MSHSKLISLNNILLLVVGCTIGLFFMILSIGFDENSILLIINLVLISSVFYYYQNTYSIWGEKGTNRSRLFRGHCR